MRAVKSFLLSNSSKNADTAPQSDSYSYLIDWEDRKARSLSVHVISLEEG